MKTITENLELQIDEKPNGYVIRLNNDKGGFLRICQIPKELIESGGFIDLIYPKPQIQRPTYLDQISTKNYGDDGVMLSPEGFNELFKSEFPPKS